MKQQKQRKSWCKFRRKLSPPRDTGLGDRETGDEKGRERRTGTWELN